jgi:hypothetical protein
VTFTVPPVARAGVVAVMSVGLSTDTAVAGLPPIVTEAPAAKFLPVIVIIEPPLVGPVAGSTASTTGPGGRVTNVNSSLAEIADVPAGVVTRTSTVPSA